MRVLVTGCAGYIGSTLCSLLLRKNYTVIGVDNFLYKNRHIVYPFAGHGKFIFHEHDVRDINSMIPIYKNVDVIIPLAAIVGAPACDRRPLFAFEINQKAITDMMKHVSPNQKVIFPNTNSGYGTSGEELCTEESPLKPISHYGLTKCNAEKAVLESPNSVSFRLATVCGASPRMRFDLMLNDFAAKLFSKQELTLFEPNYKRNFIHVQDVARAFCHMIDNNRNGIYNVGNNFLNMTKIELAHKICDYYEVPKSLVKIGDGKDPDQRNYIVSNDKIMSTGFTPQYPLEWALWDIKVMCTLCDEYLRNEMRN